METLESDMQLLLDALNFIKDDETQQIQALKTLAKMCDDKQGASYLYKHGGLKSITNIFCNTKCLQIKQWALYALSNAVQFHEPSKKLLCIPEMMRSINSILSTKEGTLVHLAGNFLLCLAKDYEPAKILARTENCLKMLLDIYRSSTPRSDVWFESMGRSSKQLWVIVSSALCSLMSNPQNNENQVLCSKALPQAVCVLRSTRKDAIFSALNFISHCVCDNPETQRALQLLGGLNTLTVLIKRLSDVDNNENAALLATALKALSHSFTADVDNDNSFDSLSFIKTLLDILQKDEICTQILSSCLVCLSRCIESSELNKETLIKNDGITVLMSTLIYIQDEEIRKIVLFLLQTCIPLHPGETMSLNNRHTLEMMKKRFKDGQLPNGIEPFCVDPISSNKISSASNINRDNHMVHSGAGRLPFSRFTSNLVNCVDDDLENMSRKNRNIRYNESYGSCIQNDQKQRKMNRSIRHSGDDRDQKFYSPSRMSDIACKYKKLSLSSHSEKDLRNEKIIRQLDLQSKLLKGVSRTVANLSLRIKSDNVEKIPKFPRNEKENCENSKAKTPMSSRSNSTCLSSNSSHVRYVEDNRLEQKSEKNENDLTLLKSIRNMPRKKNVFSDNRFNSTKTRREHNTTISTQSYRSYHRRPVNVPVDTQSAIDIISNDVLDNRKYLKERLSNIKIHNGEAIKGNMNDKSSQQTIRLKKKEDDSSQERNIFLPSHHGNSNDIHFDEQEQSSSSDKANNVKDIEMRSTQTSLGNSSNAAVMIQKKSAKPIDILHNRLIEDSGTNIAITITPGMKRRVQEMSQQSLKTKSLNERFSSGFSLNSTNDTGHEVNQTIAIANTCKTTSEDGISNKTLGNIYTNNTKKSTPFESYGASEWIKKKCEDSRESHEASDESNKSLEKYTNVSSSPFHPKYTVDAKVSPTEQLSPVNASAGIEDALTDRSMKTPLNYLSTRQVCNGYRAKRMLVFNGKDSPVEKRSDDKAYYSDSSSEDGEMSSNHSSRNSFQRAASPSLLLKSPKEGSTSHQPVLEKEPSNKCLACYPFSRFPFSVLNTRNCTNILKRDESTCDFHRNLLFQKEQNWDEPAVSRSYHQYNPFPRQRMTKDVGDLNGRKEMFKERTKTSIFSYMTSPDCENLVDMKDNGSMMDETSFSVVSKRTMTSIRRKRQDYDNDEIENILKGVERFGKRWSAILNGYKFKKGRTASDLKDKYKQLNKRRIDSLINGENTGKDNKLKPFTAEEMVNLKIGIGRYGKRWKTILKNFKFQRGRTASELRSKYERILSRF